MDCGGASGSAAEGKGDRGRRKHAASVRESWGRQPDVEDGGCVRGEREEVSAHSDGHARSLHAAKAVRFEQKERGDALADERKIKVG